ncbi:DMT family transporter [Methylobacillus sp.]|uniref:DMT family transporter n=1 Tax=Methylobacillus sp. TaxID=56818 RepID=UPI0012C7B8E9|nr:DMT family transporter [Methylobacillus sp.]MPS47654.1 DMT family transporter [Methylobacillus sp.]
MPPFLAKFFSSRQQALGVLFALVSAIGFSAKAIFVKLAYVEPVDAVTLLALRMAFSVPFFIVAMFYGQEKVVAMQRRDWLAVLVLGFIGYYLASFLDFLGLQYISAGLERLILFLYPTMVVLISALLFRERIGRTVMVALLLSYAGIVLVFVHDFSMSGDGLFLGGGLVFASAFAYAVYLVGAGHTIARIGAMRFTAYAMTVACLACIAQFLLTHPLDALRQSGRVYVLTANMALFSTVLPAFALAAAMKRIGSMQTSMIGALGPVATIYLAYVFLGEQLSLIQFLGSVLVLVGVMMISLRKKK